MTERPTILRQQVWRFRDGREGVVASTNAIGVTFYVGPQAITVPTGDLDAALYEAQLIAPTPIVAKYEALAVALAVEPDESIPAEPAKPSRRGRYRKGEPKV